MENENLRDEYVLNEYGKIVTGNYKQITTKPWLYGQVGTYIARLTYPMFQLTKFSLFPVKHKTAPHLKWL